MILVRFAISLFALALLGMALSLSAAPDRNPQGHVIAPPSSVMAG